MLPFRVSIEGIYDRLRSAICVVCSLYAFFCVLRFACIENQQTVIEARRLVFKGRPKAKFYHFRHLPDMDNVLVEVTLFAP